jgi:hypothetical protein
MFLHKLLFGNLYLALDAENQLTTTVGVEAKYQKKFYYN